MPGADAGGLELVGTWVRVLSLRTRLLGWYDREKRALPWRRDRDPYRIVVSELMLQQTRVDVVIPYFERWMERWPDVSALADATEDEVLAAWSGLGYYRRARSLLAIARTVAEEHQGVLPREPRALRELPGIGEYTAAAVASIAHDTPVPVVDGNVERVLVRLLADQRDPGGARRRTVNEVARRLVTGLVGEDPDALEPPEGLRAGDWNQALMELGATVCLPSQPNCASCPWTHTCLARHAGLTTKLPVRKPKRAPRAVTLHMAVVRRADSVLLVRRPAGELLSGMWELPTTAEQGTREDLEQLVSDHVGESVEVPPAPTRTFRHAITDRRITVRVYDVAVEGAVPPDEPEERAWTRPESFAQYGLSSMTLKAFG